MQSHHFLDNEHDQRTHSNDQSSPENVETNETLVLNDIPLQLHSAQQDINNLRLLNVCLHSTLLRLQTQLIEYLPSNNDEETKRHLTKQKLTFLRQTDDHTRKVIHPQQASFFQVFDHFKTLFDNKQQQQTNDTHHFSFVKNEKQIDTLYEMFHELHTIIHTDHDDRISQLYITLAQTSHSVSKVRAVLDQTIHAHRIIARRNMKRKIVFVLIAVTFVFVVVLFLILSIRRR